MLATNWTQHAARRSITVPTRTFPNLPVSTPTEETEPGNLPSNDEHTNSFGRVGYISPILGSGEPQTMSWSFEPQSSKFDSFSRIADFDQLDYVAFEHTVAQLQAHPGHLEQDQLPYDSAALRRWMLSPDPISTISELTLPDPSQPFSTVNQHLSDIPPQANLPFGFDLHNPQPRLHYWEPELNGQSTVPAKEQLLGPTQKWTPYCRYESPDHVSRRTVSHMLELFYILRRRFRCLSKAFLSMANNCHSASPSNSR